MVDIIDDCSNNDFVWASLAAAEGAVCAKLGGLFTRLSIKAVLDNLPGGKCPEGMPSDVIKVSAQQRLFFSLSGFFFLFMFMSFFLFVIYRSVVGGVHVSNFLCPSVEDFD